MDLVPEHACGRQRDADGLPERNAIDRSASPRTVYDVQQHFRYEYAAPIRNLRQRLVVVPRPVHGDQALLSHRLEVSEPRFGRRTYRDRFGNVVCEIEIQRVEQAVTFDVSLGVERLTWRGRQLEPAVGRALDVYRRPTTLTRPDAALRAAAIELARNGEKGPDLAAAVSRWVYGRMGYGFDRTGVHSTAAEALAAGHGVCQDYAHVMLALCRLLAIPARYVSGHLVGEGGTHAWVEVLVPAPRRMIEILAWDPTHDRQADSRYLTVAVGRDYRDVAPVSGSYHSPYRGRLWSSCRVGAVRVERGLAA